MRSLQENVGRHDVVFTGRKIKAINPVLSVIAAEMFSTGMMPRISPSSPEIPNTPNKLVNPTVVFSAPMIRPRCELGTFC